jgi:hypothetical protein
MQIYKVFKVFLICIGVRGPIVNGLEICKYLKVGFDDF